MPDLFYPNLCAVHRPFGDATATTTDLACRLVADFGRGRSWGTALTWTHRLELPAGTDVRDGVTRSTGANALTYADGDEVRVPPGDDGERFAVVWVETLHPGTPAERVRAYLLRDTPEK